MNRSLFIVPTILAMLLAAMGVRTAFLTKWKDRTHPSMLMGVTAIAIGMTAVPLRCAGDPETGPPHRGFFIAIALFAALFASSSVATALGRMSPDQIGLRLSWVQPLPLESTSRKFHQGLGQEVLNDIADTYDAVREAIRAAQEDGTCSGRYIRNQVHRLRLLADRVSHSPTADAIRAEARSFDRKARQAARSLDSAAAQFIQRSCRQRFAAAVLAVKELQDRK